VCLPCSAAQAGISLGLEPELQRIEKVGEGLLQSHRLIAKPLHYLICDCHALLHHRQAEEIVLFAFCWFRGKWCIPAR
jgi:hypothetical protein